MVSVVVMSVVTEVIAVTVEAGNVCVAVVVMAGAVMVIVSDSMLVA